MSKDTQFRITTQDDFNRPSSPHSSDSSGQTAKPVSRRAKNLQEPLTSQDRPNSQEPSSPQDQPNPQDASTSQPSATHAPPAEPTTTSSKSSKPTTSRLPSRTRASNIRRAQQATQAVALPLTAHGQNPTRIPINPEDADWPDFCCVVS